MAKLPGNVQLREVGGKPLFSLRDINALAVEEKERIYSSIIPPRLFEMFGISPVTFNGSDGERRIRFVAPEGLGILRIEVRMNPTDNDTIFFLDIADTRYRQMDLAFCIIGDPRAVRYDVDKDQSGKDNCFTTLGRNIPAEIMAMDAGLFPNQTRRGLRMFGEFFALFEQFVDAMGIEMIVAEPLTYDNAIRYEKYGFDYLTGRRLMMEINNEFKPGGNLYKKLDGSTPFRMPGADKTVLGRSWAIHDGILSESWDNVSIYKMIGESAGINTYPDREREEERLLQ